MSFSSILLRFLCSRVVMVTAVEILSRTALATPRSQEMVRRPRLDKHIYVRHRFAFPLGSWDVAGVDNQRHGHICNRTIRHKAG